MGRDEHHSPSWGGARPGAGRKKLKGERRKAKAAKAAAPAPAEANPQGVLAATFRSLAASSRASTQQKQTAGARYRLPWFPKAAVPEAKDLQLAMDSSVDWGMPDFATALDAAYAQQGLEFLGYPYLAQLSQRPEYRVISETIATEMTRKWIKFSGTGEKAEAKPVDEGSSDRDLDMGGEPAEPEQSDKVDNEKTAKIKELVDFLDHLKVREHYAAVALDDGLFGRSHLYHQIGNDPSDAELATPIGNGRDEATKAKVDNGQHKLTAIRKVEPVWCYPTTYNAQNPLSQDWYNPQVWYVMGKQIHASRIPRFVAREVPDLLKPAYAFGGLALSQLALPYVDIWLKTRESVGEMIHAFSVMVLMTDLNTLVTPQGGAAGLVARADAFNATRDNQGLFLLNKATEEFKNVSASVAGLHELQAQSQEHMMSVARIPAVKFTGIQPTGLNASSEGEIRAFYDTIGAGQNNLFRPRLNLTVDLAMISLWGERDPDITYDFVPLWELTEKEKADKRKADAETAQIHIDTGVISPVEERRRIAGDPETLYPGLDPDDVPDLKEEEDQGLEPEGGKKPGGESDGGGANDAVVPFARDEWTESDHPRGQPGNAGQFGSGGGGHQTAHAPQFGLQHGLFTAKGPSAPKGPGNVGEPLDVSKFGKVGGQKGSNPGGVYRDEDGTDFYVKKGKSKDHVRNEMTAAALYDLAGTPTLRYRPVTGGEHVATEMEKLDKDNASKLSDRERREAARDFAVHAWLGNWDAVGLGGDNLGTVGGMPTALDLGGALEYRAQGSPKGKAFGNSVGELDTLRDPKVNKDSAGVFGGMSPADLRESARYVTRVKDSQIRDAVERFGGPAALADKLIARRDDVAARARTFGAEGDPKKPGSTLVIPAGEKPPVKALNGVAFEPWRPPADWAAVDGQIEMDEPPMEVAKGKQASSGVVIREPDGRVWVVQPRGGFGGYEGTFPKGRIEEGLSPQANAIKEAYEESGLKVRIVGLIGDREGDATTTRYYEAVREGGDPGQHDDESEGVVLAPQDKLGGFVNRRRDRDILGLDAAWEESKHPRDEGGQFSETAGGAGQGGEPPDDDPDHGEKPEAGSAAKPKKTAFGGLWKSGEDNPAANFQMNAAHVLAKPTNAGSSYRQMLAFMVKEAPKHGHAALVPALKAKLGEAFKLAGEKAQKLMEAETDHAKKIVLDKIATKAFQQASNYGVTKQVPVGAASKPAPAPEVKKVDTASVTKAIAEQALKDNPGMAAALKSLPTPAELDKAKKSVALQAQYVPGFGDLQFTQTQEQASALVNEFNSKWAGKDGLLPVQLGEKVKDFKVLAAKVATLKAAEAVNAKQMQAAQKVQQDAKNKKAAAELKEQQEAAKAKNKQYMDALGISEVEATGFDALVQMMGEKSGDVIAKFKNYESAAEKLGYKGVSGFQYALIRNYIDGGYHAINTALRGGSVTTAQHVYAKLVNDALEKFPKYAGTVTRGTTLNVAQLSAYKPGHVIEERSFTSTGINYKFGGNVHYTIKANGNRGADFSGGANPGEKEVLFKAHTFFLVHKVENKGGVTHIEMEEVEGHG